MKYEQIQENSHINIDKINEIKAIIQKEGFLLIENFPIFNTRDELQNAFKSFCSSFGNLVAQDSKGTIVASVEDEENSTLSRGHKSNEMLPFHNDRCDIIALLCISPAESGGRTTVIRSRTIYDHLEQHYPAELKVLCEDFYFDKKDDIFGTEDFYKLPVFINHGNNILTRYIRKFINSAQTKPGVPEMTPLQKNALDCLDSVLEDPKFQNHFSLNRGELLLISNLTTLHSRTSFLNSQNNRRLLLRVWLANPDLINLPDNYESFFGSVNSKNRGGMRMIENNISIN